MPIWSNLTPVSVCQVNEAEPPVMWLSGLHIPESYLTALVQATCRKNGWPLDKSTLYTNVTTYATADDVTERTTSGQRTSLLTTQSTPLWLIGFFNLLHKQHIKGNITLVLMHSGIVNGYQLLCDAHTVL